MPPSHPDRVDSDPLLAFLSELESAASSFQPVETAEVPSAAAAADAPAQPINPLADRLEKLEQALDGATAEVMALRSQVATLVRATRDIDKRVDRLSSPLKPIPAGNLRRNRAVTGIVGTAFGIALAAWSWSYATTNRDAIVMHAAAASPASPVDSPAPVNAPVDVPAAESPKAAAAVNTPSREQQPAPQRVDYVGSLTIDASPGGQVLVNGQDAGRTPLRLENLKAGAHLIWIEREGYRRWTKVVDVAAGRVSRVFADLEPIASR